MPIDKIIHFSDLHIKPYKDHDLFCRILSKAFNEWRDLSPDRIVFTGDLLHLKTQLTPELLRLSSWVLEECAKISKTILILGNHDALINNLDRLDAITPIVDTIKNDNIVFYKDMGVYEDENVSWCVYSQLQNNDRPDIENAKNFKIGLFHGPVQGLKTDLGFEFGDHAYDIDKFSGLDLVLCGDIHKRARFPISNGRFGVMIGSFIQHKIDETVVGHGYGVYHVDSDTYEYKDIFNPNPYLQFKINSIDDIVNQSEQLINYGD